MSSDVGDRPFLSVGPVLKLGTRFGVVRNLLVSGVKYIHVALTCF